MPASACLRMSPHNALQGAHSEVVKLDPLWTLSVFIEDQVKQSILWITLIVSGILNSSFKSASNKKHFRIKNNTFFIENSEITDL